MNTRIAARGWKGEAHGAMPETPTARSGNKLARPVSGLAHAALAGQLHRLPTPCRRSGYCCSVVSLTVAGAAPEWREDRASPASRAPDEGRTLGNPSRPCQRELDSAGVSGVSGG